MAHEQFRLHDSFRLIEAAQPGDNAALLAELARMIGAGQSFAISTAPTLRIEALPGLPGEAPHLSSLSDLGFIRATQADPAQSGLVDPQFEINRQALGLTGTDRHAVLGSLASSLASYAAVEAMHLGTGLIDLCGASPARQLRQLSETGASMLYCSPAQLRLPITAARGGGALTALRHVICGGGKLDEACKRQRLCPGARIRILRRGRDQLHHHLGGRHAAGLGRTRLSGRRDRDPRRIG